MLFAIMALHNIMLAVLVLAFIILFIPNYILGSYRSVELISAEGSVQNSPLAPKLPPWLTSDTNQTSGEETVAGITLELRDPKVLDTDSYSATVYINSTNQTLYQINSVTYRFHESFRPDTVTVEDSPTNGFEHPFYANGFFLLRGEVKFDNETIKSLSKTFDLGPGYIYPPDLTIFDPRVDGMKVSVDGEAVSVANITRIEIDWGDGQIEEGAFPFSHIYSRPGLYTITVTAFDNNGQFVAKSVQTSALLLNLLQNRSSFAIDENANAILIMDDTADYLYETEVPSGGLEVSGSMLYLNGTGIPNEKILVTVSNDNEGAASDRKSYIDTRSDGTFSRQLTNLNLREGAYTLAAEPDGRYAFSNLRTTTQINVLPREVTLQEFLTYAGGFLTIGGGVYAYVEKIRPSIQARRQKTKLTDYMRYIIEDCKSCENDKLKCRDSLNKRRDMIITALREGEITQEQYQMLDQMISECVENIEGNRQK